MLAAIPMEMALSGRPIWVGRGAPRGKGLRVSALVHVALIGSVAAYFARHAASDETLSEYPGKPMPAAVQSSAQLDFGVLALEADTSQSSGFTILDAAALAAARRWRFVAAKRGGTPVAAAKPVAIRFRLAQ